MINLYTYYPTPASLGGNEPDKKVKVNCYSCKHWSTPADSNATKGTCLKINYMLPGGETSLSGDNALLETRRDFGCSLFEPVKL